MKRPYLSNYLEEYDLKVNSEIFYDSLSQISYTDDGRKQRLIDKVWYENTLHTRSIENSDADELNTIGSSRLTEQVEDSDPDEIWLIGSTKLTFTKEDTDPDEINASGFTDITKAIEDSDADEIYTLGGTWETAAKEDSDPDEYQV
jgi:hypothetical protein